MSKVGDVYFCEICGRKVKIIEEEPREPLCCVEPMAGDLVCCGVPMKIAYKSK